MMLLLNGTLNTSPLILKVEAEAPTVSDAEHSTASSDKAKEQKVRELMKLQPEYHIGVLEPGESYINDGGRQISLDDELALLENGPKLHPTVRSSSKTLLQALNWANAQVGRSIEIDGEPKWDPIQCVDFTMAYSYELFKYHIDGSAFQYAQWDRPGFTRMSGVIPQPGDIAVWTGWFWRLWSCGNCNSTIRR